jgi:heme oxygenase
MSISSIYIRRLGPFSLLLSSIRRASMRISKRGFPFNYFSILYFIVKRKIF